MAHHKSLRAALVAAIVGAAALPVAALAQTQPLLTIVDGPVQVLRGATRFDAAEGLALAEGDIVRTASSARVARIEFGERRALDLGPDTQVMLLSSAGPQAQDTPGASALLLQGWAKFSAGEASGRLLLPRAVAVADAHGALLAQAATDGTALAFAESRGLTLLPRHGTGAEVLLREGETWTRDGATGAVRVSARAAALRDMPRALADSLPHRAAMFDGRTVTATDGRPLEATDLAAWTRAEPQLMALRASTRGIQRTTSRPTLRAPERSKLLTTRSTRLRPAPQAAAAPIALPPTVFLAAEPVATVRLP
jgi:hypothetical protein